MKISVVIPAYNEESYIEATLRAAMALKYPDFEVIVVNNASIDATADKVRNMIAAHGNALPKISMIDEKQAGVQFAREAGRRVATGELIANLDADCVAPADWLAKAAAYFEKNRRVVAVTGPYDYYDVSPSMRMVSSFSYKVLRNVLNKTLSAVFGFGGLIGGNCVMRADALAKIGGYDTDISFHGDDTDTGNRLAKLGKVLFRNSLTVGSSARRIKRIGVVKLTWQYMSNYFWILFFKKTYNNKDNGRYADN